MTEQNKKGCLIFIFNANSDTISSIKDFFHKMIKPLTYNCNLCAVTFGNFGMKKDWAEYVSGLEEDVNIEFLHKDEFEKYYDINDANYPSAYFHAKEFTKIFITQDEMNAVGSVKALKDLVNKRLKEFI